MPTTSLSWIAGWSYNAQGGYRKVAEHTSGSKKEKINSITVSLGTGNDLFNSGTALTGNGSTLTVTMRFGDSAVSNSQSVSNKVGHLGNSTNYYPDRSDLQSYTFTFSDLEIPANTTYYVYISTPTTAEGTTGPVLCMNQAGTINYTEIEDVKYTLTLNTNGGSVDPSSYTEVKGTSITLPTPSKSYKLTYDSNGGSVNPSYNSRSCSFKNWNTKSDGSGTSYSAGSSYTLNANATLYAIWTNPTAGTLPSPTRTNCQFEMWTTSKNGSTQVTSTTVISSNTTIYAKWKYNIVYNGNGGYYSLVDSDDYQEVSQITDIKNHDQNYVIKDYYFYIKSDDPDDPASKQLKNFNTKSDGSGTVYNIGSTYSSNSPLTLYAIYDVETFVVTFEDGYSGTILKKEIVSYNGSATPPPDPTRPGYTFAGWIGNYTNVKSNSTIKAFWGMTPIWIMTSLGWKKYEPKE